MPSQMKTMVLIEVRTLLHYSFFATLITQIFRKLETRSVERFICPIASPQRPNCSVPRPIINKGYIAYFSLRMRERLYFPLPV